MIKKYFLQQYLQEEYVHGGVTNVDAEKILVKEGFEPVFFPYQDDFSLKAKFGRLFFLLRKLMAIKRGSVVVFLFPFYATMHKLFIRLLRMKKIKLVCFIVDIDGIKDGDDRLLKDEIAFFKQLHFFIVLNDAMTGWLKQQVPGAIAHPIYFHTFLAQPVNVDRKKSYNVVFAGNLAKSPYLEHLHLLKKGSPNLQIELFGPGATDAMTNQENVNYRGVEKPHELPYKLTGSFGLVWEGDSIAGPEGSLGNYIQFITHNKISLYIVSGLPIIIPASAGTAPLIEQYKIGFAVNSLYEVEEKITRLTDEEYRQMQANLRTLAPMVSRGDFLSIALDNVMKDV